MAVANLCIYLEQDCELNLTNLWWEISYRSYKLIYSDVIQYLLEITVLHIVKGINWHLSNQKSLQQGHGCGLHKIPLVVERMIYMYSSLKFAQMKRKLCSLCYVQNHVWRRHFSSLWRQVTKIVYKFWKLLSHTLGKTFMPQRLANF